MPRLDRLTKTLDLGSHRVTVTIDRISPDGASPCYELQASINGRIAARNFLTLGAEDGQDSLALLTKDDMQAALDAARMRVALIARTRARAGDFESELT